MTLKSYTIGFVSSLLLTFLSYIIVTSKWAMGWWLLAILGVLALVQMVTQLAYFLHLGEEVRPRYKLASFVFMFGIMSIVVLGSLWIMQHLDHNMMDMSASQKDNYMMSEHDRGF